jgi:hypothetical protein
MIAAFHDLVLDLAGLTCNEHGMLGENRGTGMDPLSGKTGLNIPADEFYFPEFNFEKPPGWIVPVSLSAVGISLVLSLAAVFAVFPSTAWIPIGFVGYVLALWVPLGLLVRLRIFHISRGKNNPEGYDALIGQRYQERMNFVAIAGFVVSLIAIWLIAQPFGEIIAVRLAS